MPDNDQPAPTCPDCGKSMNDPDGCIRHVGGVTAPGLDGDCGRCGEDGHESGDCPLTIEEARRAVAAPSPSTVDEARTLPTVAEESLWLAIQEYRKVPHRAEVEWWGVVQNRIDALVSSVRRDEQQEVAAKAVRVGGSGLCVVHVSDAGRCLHDADDHTFSQCSMCDDEHPFTPASVAPAPAPSTVDEARPLNVEFWRPVIDAVRRYAADGIKGTPFPVLKQHEDDIAAALADREAAVRREERERAGR